MNYKFKALGAKGSGDHTNEWVEGFYVKDFWMPNRRSEGILLSSNEYVEIDRDTLLMSTDKFISELVLTKNSMYKDATKKEIWQNDIINIYTVKYNEEGIAEKEYLSSVQAKLNEEYKIIMPEVVAGASMEEIFKKCNIVIPYSTLMPFTVWLVEMEKAQNNHWEWRKAENMTDYLCRKRLI